jgi:flagellin
VAAGSTAVLADLGLSANGPHYGTARTGADIQQEINDKFAADAEMSKAGLHATYSGTTFTINTGTTGTAFRMAAFSVNGGNIGFGTVGAAFTGNLIAVAKSSVADSGGASNSASLDFTALSYGSENQTITVSGNDSTGALHASSIKLQNIAGNTSGRSIEEALTAINTALQSSNDKTLQKITAVRETDADGNEKVNFLSTLPSFNVSVGTSAYGEGLASLDSANNRVQGTTVTSAVLDGGSTADISNQATAQGAVNALATAVSSLGSAQAVVGKGQNQFNYAINLASTQITNLSAAESRIRDADLAAEAANLTKAQILQQAGVAAMAQANSAPQAILSLLRG